MRLSLPLCLALPCLWHAGAVMAAEKPVPKKPSASKTPSRAAPPAKAKVPEAQTLDLGDVRGTLPGTWTSQPPGGQFRVAQHTLPKAAGDTAAPLLIAFHFGPGGGGEVEDNVKRWIGMVRQPDGSDSSKVVRRARVEPEGLRITTVDLAGTYLDRPFPMSQEATPRPNYRMFAAVIETTKEGSQGPYYLRLVGPAKGVEAAKPGWDALIASLRAR